MPFVITENSTVNCDHPGAGTVELTAGQSKLTVGGSKALVENDLNGAPISGCANTTNPNTGVVQCTTILSTAGGVAGKLKVDGKAVLLEDITCLTSGQIGPDKQRALVQAAGQSKLKTV